jgi:opacity protein-like surface antigen
MAQLHLFLWAGFAILGSSAVYAEDVADGKQSLPAYLSVSGGFNYADSDRSPTFDGKVFFKDGWTGAAAMGSNFSDHVRGEIEVALRKNSLDKVKVGGFELGITGNTKIFTGMAKLAYDFGDGAFRPYLGAGIGLGNFMVHTGGGTDSETALAGSVQAGVNYEISPKAAFFVDAQALMLADVNVDPDNSGNTKIENPLFLTASVGLRFWF